MIGDYTLRVSVEAIEEELGDWRKELDELQEMMSHSKEMNLGTDFISQLQHFLPVKSLCSFKQSPLSL